MLPVDGAAITAAASEGRREIVGAIGPDAASLADAQAATGEGPGPDCYRIGAPVRVADFSAALVAGRWPLLAQWDGVTSVAAVCSIPLRLGAIRVGYLDLLDAASLTADPEAYLEALRVAEVVTTLLLAALTPPHDGAEAGAGWELSSSAREIHQATGMVAVQLDTTAAIAYARLVGHAFAAGRRLDEIASDVVARRVRFFPDPRPGHNGGPGAAPASEH
ncbi:ANTAR domain-containing protein [Nocardia otitidiscaviarum]|uniref:ANTAR domain-containing protein n=1 Tax=Nocardia otitidiscaviarum TaxID=1823 RepID=UPI000694AAF1|nr:ANTAR domain-containing protein [Nocardia otitidiscaviarum]MBF6132516.1 ANTAR domain-containing protein [Nocardia otitidiscaviarum]MBF6488894.1 ANTAR domain-containing protein [Nocardia otitidiscaviarum]